ncbi:MAG: LCP family protein, partial [Clostridia bacterium]|nr:LCP family protein [Clostridia bacterium]
MLNLSSLKKKIKTSEKKKPVSKAQKKEQKKQRMKKIAIISAAALLAIFFLVFGIYHWVLDYYVEKLNIVTEETGMIFETEQIETDEVNFNGELNNDNLPLICDTKNVKNILLLAVDSRGKEAGLSDSMILLSINRKTDKIVLCSFLRDILAHFPKEPESPAAGKYSKLTHAHSYGGPELTMAVLKETFNIEVDYYAKINFYSFVDMVDLMGGVDVYMTSAEIGWINNHFLTERVETHELFPSYPKTLITGGEGVKHLNGLQALGHARNRSVGSDFSRTQRQRDILQA